MRMEKLPLQPLPWKQKKWMLHWRRQRARVLGSQCAKETELKTVYIVQKKNIEIFQMIFCLRDFCTSSKPNRCSRKDEITTRR